MVEMRAMGEPQSAIAKAVGCTQAAVSIHLSKENIKKLVEDVQNKFLSETLDASANNIRDVIVGYKNESDKQVKEHGFKASMAVMQGVGALPSIVQAQFIQNVYNDNRKFEIPEEILEYRKHKEDAVVLEAEYEDVR